MPNSRNHIAEFGKFGFEEKPLCEADVLAIAQIFYMPFEWVVSEDFTQEPVSFINAASRVFAMRGGEHKPMGLMINKTPSRVMMMMAATKRYAGLRLAAVKEVYSRSPAVQFCAGTFLLPDGTALICFRGTDDTVAGWKEDVDLLTRYGTPSYDLAMDYLTRAAAAFDGDILLCGHSKGGNIALRTAVMCDPAIRARIKNVYNFDGPGYFDTSLFEQAAYAELLPGYRHYVPSDSFIGMLLYHDYDYKAIKSTRLLGPMQHDLASWQVKDGALWQVKDNDALSKWVDGAINSLVERLGTENYGALDTVVTAVTEGLNQKTLTDVAKNIREAVNGAAEAYRLVEPAVKEQLHEAFRKSKNAVAAAAKKATAAVG